LGDPGFQETEGVLAQWFARHAVMAAIIRPDHYIYGVAAEVASLIRQLKALKLD
jgi:3-(3-hydroxy-phenyl)propionate hydroxylase